MDWIVFGVEPGAGSWISWERRVVVSEEKLNTWIRLFSKLQGGRWIHVFGRELLRQTRWEVRGVEHSTEQWPRQRHYRYEQGDWQHVHWEVGTNLHNHTCI